MNHKIEYRNYCWGFWEDYHCKACDEKVSICTTPTQSEFIKKQEFLIKHSPNINPRTCNIKPFSSDDFKQILDGKKHYRIRTLQYDYENNRMKKEEDILKFFLEPLKLEIDFLSIKKCKIETKPIKPFFEDMASKVYYIITEKDVVIKLLKWDFLTHDFEYGDTNVLSYPEKWIIKRRTLLKSDGTEFQVGYKIREINSSRGWIDGFNNDFSYLTSRKNSIFDGKVME